MWPRRKKKNPETAHKIRKLDEQLVERREHLAEVKARTPAAQAAGAKAQKLVTANGFTTAIAVSMERR
jgi:DNA-binding protein H-NS